MTEILPTGVPFIYDVTQGTVRLNGFADATVECPSHIKIPLLKIVVVG